MASTVLQALSFQPGFNQALSPRNAAAIIREKLDPVLCLRRKSEQIGSLMRIMRKHPDGAMLFSSQTGISRRDFKRAALQVAADLLDDGNLEKASALAHLARLNAASVMFIKPRALALLGTEVGRGEILKAANMSIPFSLTRKDTAPFRGASLRWLGTAPPSVLVNAGSMVPIAFHLTANETSGLKPNAIRGLCELLREDATRPIKDSSILLVLAATGAYGLCREDLIDIIAPVRGRVKGFLMEGDIGKALAVATAFGITSNELLMDIDEINIYVRGG